MSPSMPALRSNLVLGGLVPVQINAPDAEAGRPYIILASIFGKVPGLPLSSFFDPSDTRYIANNFDSFLWGSVSNATILPGFFSVLDMNGDSPPNTGFLVPNDISIAQLNLFCDLTYVVLHPPSQNRISRVGGTAQLLLGN